MKEDFRPDPDQLLEAIKKEEEKNRKGKLKIFLGMAAGVGKTYAMLSEGARLRLNDLVNVIIGVVETHGRKETEELSFVIPSIPRKKIPYKGNEFQELDLDAVLELKPDIVLIDELAHTNIPGARHSKRYQDVQEILDAGINVYTTLNIQHVESQTDLVAKMTGITVYETVPDSIIDLADEIELIDLPVTELMKRLSEGKIYPSSRVETASLNFFKKENLTALREMALRTAAERVDKQLNEILQFQSEKSNWKGANKILVTVGPSPTSRMVLRSARRIAGSMEAELTAVFVETPGSLKPSEREDLQKNINYARELGAEAVITAAETVAEGILNAVRTRNIYTVITGRPETGFIKSFFFKDLHDRLMAEEPDLNIFIIQGQKKTNERPSKKSFISDMEPVSGIKEYFQSLLSVALVTLVNLALLNFTGYWSISLIYLMSVLVLALFLGRGPVMAAAVISGFLWNFLFIPPRFTFFIHTFEDFLMLLIYIFAALIAGIFTTKIRQREKLIQNREKINTYLYRHSEELAVCNTAEEIARVTVRNIKNIFSSECIYAVPENGMKIISSSEITTFSPKEYSVAQWSFDKKKKAGRFTDTLSSSEGHYIPVQTATSNFGVIGIFFSEEIYSERYNEFLIDSIAGQTALSLERMQIRDEAVKNKLLYESEKFSRTLLNSISHEIRTPLSQIKGASSILHEKALYDGQDYSRELTEEIQESVEDLDHIINNLLDMTRLESGKVKLKMDWTDPNDLIQQSIKRTKGKLIHHKVIVDSVSSVPQRMDVSLMEHVLVNLLLNAAIHTKKGTVIKIKEERTGKYYKLIISNNDFPIFRKD
ncbi:MAG TPA: sensor histidine kinase KdpD, partial [Leptospiraceae bacterium]|nr:sensor histidine kinase KdpD [Leptospiraceae bacterium]